MVGAIEKMGLTCATYQKFKNANSFKTSHEKKNFLLLTFMFFTFEVAGIFFALVRKTPVSELIFFSIFLLLFSLSFLYAFHVFLTDEKGKVYVRRVVLLLIGALICSLFLEAGTLVGSPTRSVFALSDWIIKRIAFFYAISVWGLIGLTFAFLKINKFLKEEKIADFKSFVRNRKTLSVISVALAFIAIFTFTSLISFLAPQSHLSFISSICSIIFGGIAFIYGFFKAKTVQYFFLTSILIIGSILFFCLPQGTLISWDDEIHYENSKALSFVVFPSYSEADKSFKSFLGPQSQPDEFSPFYPAQQTSEELKYYYSFIRDAEEKNVAEIPNSVLSSYNNYSAFNLPSFSYAPFAVGLWIGRLLDMDWVLQFVLAKFLGFVVFALIGYFAIKIMPMKKVLMAAILSLLTPVFLSVSFSYDPWILAFTSLGFALLLRAKASEQPPSTWCLMGISGIFIVALISKAVYFPILGFFLLLNGNYEKTTKFRRLTPFFFACVSAAILFLTFVLPLVVSGPGAGDPRGGAEVNDSSQFSFILSNPLQTVKIISSFIILKYLSPLHGWGSGGYISSMAYAQTQSPQIVLSLSIGIGIILLLIAIMDVDDASMKLATIKMKLWAVFVISCTVILVCLALYISFTPVGSNTVAGVQQRYLLPLLFPILAFIFNFKIVNKYKPVVFAFASLGSICFINILILFLGFLLPSL